MNNEKLLEVAKRKIREQKEKARLANEVNKLEQEKLKQVMKEKDRKARMEAKKQSKENKENERLKAIEIKKEKAYLITLVEEVLNHYSSIKVGESKNTNTLTIKKLSDGNVVGKIGDIYFKTMQENSKTYINLIEYIGDRTISDYDRYPTFVKTHVYRGSRARIVKKGIRDVELNVVNFNSIEYTHGNFLQTDEYKAFENDILNFVEDKKIK